MSQPYYETMYILRPDIPEEEVETHVTKYRDLVTEAGAEVLDCQMRGKRRLAYPIAKDTQGYFLWYQVEMPEDRVNNLARAHGFEPVWESIDALQAEDQTPLVPPMVTLQILGGRKEKIRAGDVLGALTGEAGFTASQIGKINVNEQSTYVAVERSIARQALKRLSEGKIKGKKVRVFLLDE